MAMTLDAVTLIFKRHVFVPNDGIGVGKKAWRGDADKGHFGGTVGTTSAQKV